ncbi:MAG: DUF438 domain-containing protein [Caldisericia bacterium]|jgi:PAS domain S-box-containing protein|nr:DUF438 domain-containing protein [Caldisericia bacterium]
MSEFYKGFYERKEILKDIIRRIHKGEDPEKVKSEFSELLKEVQPDEIAKIEEELIREGMDRNEIQKLCEVHLLIFKESLNKKEEIDKGNPINILMKEHELMLKMGDELTKLFNLVKDELSFKENEGKISEIIKNFKDSESHYLREENALFPTLEKYGVVEPPKIMWMEHDKIREIKKSLFESYEKLKENFKNDVLIKIKSISLELFNFINSHFFKENNILFPTANKLFKKEDFLKVKKDFDEIGYPTFLPDEFKEKISIEIKEEKAAGGEIELPTGSFSLDELESILNTLPVDITFVDKNDKVKYFSMTKDRIFVRTKAVLGRSVQNCHPQKSVHIVNKILEEFKKGTRDSAEFWINLNGRLIYIRYFAVRKNGEYLGTIEVTQDITDIKKIEGEKRLLDWE